MRLHPLSILIIIPIVVLAIMAVHKKPSKSTFKSPRLHAILHEEKWDKDKKQYSYVLYYKQNIVGEYRLDDTGSYILEMYSPKKLTKTGFSNSDEIDKFVQKVINNHVFEPTALDEERPWCHTCGVVLGKGEKACSICGTPREESTDREPENDDNIEGEDGEVIDDGDIVMFKPDGAKEPQPPEPMPWDVGPINGEVCEFCNFYLFGHESTCPCCGQPTTKGSDDWYERCEKMGNRLWDASLEVETLEDMIKSTGNLQDMKKVILKTLRRVRKDLDESQKDAEALQEYLW